MIRIVFAALFVAAASWAHAAQVLYVSPDGNDAWSGRYSEPLADGSDGPLATPHAARDRARELDRAEPITILFRGGEYFMDETLILTHEDAGTRAAPVHYAAASGETPIFSTGRRITDWEIDGDGR